MSSIKNTTNLYNLNPEQQKGLKLQLNKLDLNNRLILTLNKKIEKFPHNKVSDKLGGSLNQNIIFNFSNKNANTDKRLNNNLVTTRPVGKVSLINDISLVSDAKNKTGNGKNAIRLLRSKVADLGPVQVKNPARLGITNNVVKLITSFFKGLSCLIGRPQFIHKTDKIIVRIFFYQNNFYKDALFSNNKLNFIYNLFNGIDAAKAQYSAPKSQNFTSIIRDMLGQTKWNKEAQTIFKNNEAINSLELANISKTVFILFIKDLMNLTSSNKVLSIEKALTHLQKGAPTLASVPAAFSLKGASRFLVRPALQPAALTHRVHGLDGVKKYNQLLIKLISSTNSESLTRKRTRLSKTFFNKFLLAKVQNKINKHNNSLDVHLRPSKVRGKIFIASALRAAELIGKGALMSPVSKAKLDKLVGWSSNNLDLSIEYKTISSALLVLLKNNEVNNSQTVSSLSAKLANRINKILTSLSTQFADEFRNNVNFIINNTPSFDAGKLLSCAGLNDNLNLSSTYLKGTQPSNALNIIKLINHNFSPSLGSKMGGKTLSVVKETLKAYSYNINKNKADSARTGIISRTDNVNKFKLLGTFLSKIFQKNVELQLVKLHNVGLEDTILSKVISENARFDKSSVIFKKLLRKISLSKASLIQFNKQNSILNGDARVYEMSLHNKVRIPAFAKAKLNKNQQIGVNFLDLIDRNKKNIRLAQLYDQVNGVQILNSNPLALGKVVGLNIRIAGRLQKEPVRPKQTVKTVSIGSLSKERANITSLSSFTSKNRKGSYRITVKMAHTRTFATSTKQL